MTCATDQPGDRVVSLRVGVCQKSRFSIPSSHSSRVFGIWQQCSAQKVWPVGLHRQACREEQEHKTGRCRASVDEETQPSTHAFQCIVKCSPSVTAVPFFDPTVQVDIFGVSFPEYETYTRTTPAFAPGKQDLAT